MSSNNGSSTPNIIHVKNPEIYDTYFPHIATPPSKDITYHACCSNCMKDSSAGVPMQRCSRCKLTWYCSKNCQKEHWHKHKESCHDVEGPSISRVLRKFAANKLLNGLLQACLVCYFDLLHNSDPNKIFMARIDVGIEPSDKTIGFKLFSGADVSGDIEGILQLNAITSCDLITKPLTPNRLHIWRLGREAANAAGCSSDAVGLVEFVNDSPHSVTMPIQVGKGAMLAVQHAEPFKFISAIGHTREVPMNALTCLEFINTHIRSDSKNLLGLRMTMREADKEIIRAAGRDEERDAVVIFKEKMAREGAYRFAVLDD